MLLLFGEKELVNLHMDCFHLKFGVFCMCWSAIMCNTEAQCHANPCILFDLLVELIEMVFWCKIK